jgi:uncharacterized membrane protein HdeD (DUF308 family)
VRNATLVSRGALSAIMVVLGIIILVRMLPLVSTGGFATVPGLILGVALIALGVHKISLIIRIRRTP